MIREFQRGCSACLTGMVILLSGACKKESADNTTIDFTNLPTQTIQASLQGDWHLISWCGGIAGGCTIINNHVWGARLRVSGNTAVFRNLEGENLRGTMSWKTFNPGYDSLQSLYVDSVNVGIPLGIKNGRLTITNGIPDGYDRSYQRD